MKVSVKPQLKQKSITLGDMLEYWRVRGSFNEDLYRRISIIKTSR
jgi:hypothetical protein